MKRTFTGVTLAILAAGLVLGQSGPTSTASAGFDVASIKPSDPATRGMQIGVSPGGMFTAKGVTVKVLVQQAYDIRDFQISGGPGWLDTEKYDIVAKSENLNVSEDDLRKMTNEQRNQFQQKMQGKLRLLLADRFQLKVRRETKELPVYALVVAKNGPKIQESKDDGTPGGSLSFSGDGAKFVVTGKKAALSSLARTLSNQVGRPVLDKTGLTGNYDFKMTFARDLEQQPPKEGAADRPVPTDPDGPSIFTALQEQLGLKLDSQKGPVEVVVIESVEKASEN